MRLDILKALNEERAARRAAIVVTNQDSGAQRLVTAKDVAADPLKSVLEKHLQNCARAASRKRRKARCS